VGTPIRLALGAIVLAFAPAVFAAEFVPEVVTVKAAIDPGPNVFVYQQEWKGAGRIAVFGQADLAFKGLMTSGSMAAIAAPAQAQDGKALTDEELAAVGSYLDTLNQTGQAIDTTLIAKTRAAPPSHSALQKLRKGS